MKKCDDNFPEGVFAIPHPSKELRVKVWALHNYGEKKGITPAT